MADYIHYITWYTVYSAKTGEVMAAGTSAMCAAKLGYKTVNSFASAAGHRKSRPRKYVFERELIRRDEVDGLPPVRRRKKQRPARVPTRTGPKGDEFRRPSPRRITHLEKNCKPVTDERIGLHSQSSLTKGDYLWKRM